MYISLEPTIRTTVVGTIARWCKPRVSIGWLSFGKGEVTRAMTGTAIFDQTVTGTIPGTLK